MNTSWLRFLLIRTKFFHTSAQVLSKLSTWLQENFFFAAGISKSGCDGRGGG